MPPTLFTLAEGEQPGRAYPMVVQEFISGTGIEEALAQDNFNPKLLIDFLERCLKMYEDHDAIPDFAGATTIPLLPRWGNPVTTPNVIIEAGREHRPCLVDTSSARVQRFRFTSRAVHKRMADRATKLLEALSVDDYTF